MNPTAMYRLLVSLALTMLMLPGTATAQATHIVTVAMRQSDPDIDRHIFPSNLTIPVGDTVEWRTGGGDGEHNVTSDNGGFPASPTAHTFTYAHTFNSVGTFPYHCTVHGKAGTINVVAQGDPFQINVGLNDAWGDQAVNKQGFFITVFPDIGKFFLSWFTYDVERPANGVTANLGEPGHRWLTAFGDYIDDTAVLDIELTQGGIFDANPPDPPQSPYGTITVTFSSCTEGELHYNIPSLGLSRTMPIQRTYTSPENASLCESLQ